MKPKPYKPKKAICKQCGEDYIRERAFTVCCSIPCALKYASKRSKSETKKKRTLALKEYKSSDKSHLMKIAQKEFNKFIRLRDKGKPCCSCGHTGNRQRHASHFRPVGSNGKHRFNEINVNASCSICNTHLSGNLVPYREFLVKKYGEEKVQELEDDNSTYKYSIEELKEIIEKYRDKIKKIENNL